MSTVRSIKSYERQPTRVRSSGYKFTRAVPNGAVPLKDAARLMQLTELDMARLATVEALWMEPDPTATIRVGIRRKFLDAVAFNRFRQSLLKAERKAEDFRSRMTSDL